MSQWWENAEEGRASRYEDPGDYVNHPTRAECEADEREIAAMRARSAVVQPYAGEFD